MFLGDIASNSFDIDHTSQLYRFTTNLAKPTYGRASRLWLLANSVVSSVPRCYAKVCRGPVGCIDPWEIRSKIILAIHFDVMGPHPKTSANSGVGRSWGGVAADARLGVAARQPAVVARQASAASVQPAALAGLGVAARRASAAAVADLADLHLGVATRHACALQAAVARRASAAAWVQPAASADLAELRVAARRALQPAVARRASAGASVQPDASAVAALAASPAAAVLAVSPVVVFPACVGR